MLLVKVTTVAQEWQQLVAFGVVAAVAVLAEQVNRAQFKQTKVA